LAEIAQGDLVESWETAVNLSATALADMSKLAGARLASVLENNIDAADLTDVVSDAAVLFLLAMRRAGVRTPDEIGPCTLLWDEAKHQELIVKRACSMADKGSFMPAPELVRSFRPGLGVNLLMRDVAEGVRFAR